MNQKGFTLVEILATLIVLAVLMAITVPNITGIIASNKQSVGKEDVSKMISGVRARIKRKEALYPKSKDACNIFTLDFIDMNDDFKKAVNGGTYNKTESFVVVAKREISSTWNSSRSAYDYKYEYKYYVRILEEKNDKKLEILLGDYDEFVRDSRPFMSPETSPGTENTMLNLTTSSLEDTKNNINNLARASKTIKSYGCDHDYGECRFCTSVEHVYK